MSLEDIMQSDRRLLILRALNAANGYALRDSVLQRAIETSAAAVSLDRLRTDLDWLAEQNLLAVQRADAHWMASITDRGMDIATGRASVNGVDRPRPGAV